MSAAPVPPGWKGWGVSCTGPGHARAGLPNQDAWLLRRFPWGELLVVADGLGSRAMSHHGARAVCQAALEATAALAQGQVGPPPQALLAALHAAWLARLWPHAARECATTCLLALRTGPQLLLAQLGDGMAVACAQSGQPAFVLAPAKTGFGNLTDCLRERHHAESWRVASLNTADWCGVLLCTDGIADDLAAGMEADFASALMASGRGRGARSQRREARRWLRDWPVPGHADDKTIVCLMAPEEQGNAG